MCNIHASSAHATLVLPVDLRLWRKKLLTKVSVHSMQSFFYAFEASSFVSYFLFCLLSSRVGLGLMGGLQTTLGWVSSVSLGDLMLFVPTLPFASVLFLLAGVHTTAV